MGILNKLGDSFVEGLSNSKIIRLSYEEMAKLVNEYFIVGANDEYLDKVRIISKGGKIKFRELMSINGRYKYNVSSYSMDIVEIFLKRKSVLIFDKDTNKYYKLDREIHWKKFFKEIEMYIKFEKINRNK